MTELITEVVVDDRLTKLLYSPDREASDYQDIVNDVQECARELSKICVRDEEMPRNLILVSRVNYFIFRCYNAGVHEFLLGTSAGFVADLIEAFETIDAVEHADAMRRFSDYMKGQGDVIDTKALREFVKQVEEELLTKVHARNPHWGGPYDDPLEAWEPLLYPCVLYIETWTNLRFVPYADYKIEIRRLAVEGIPDLAERIAARQQARAWEKKAIERLMLCDENSIHYTTFTAREWGERKVWCWNFTTTPGESGGHHQAIFIDGEIIIFAGESTEVIARADAAECAIGSTVPRNEPKDSPHILDPKDGWLPNLYIRIGED